MDYSYFYQIICEVYKKDNNENYNKSLLDSVNWLEFYKFSNNIYYQFIANFDNYQQNSEILNKCENIFNMGYECCNSPMSIPYFYWSDYCWDLLEKSSYSEQVNILNTLPCMTCREHAQKYIYDTYVDLVNMKNDINKNN